ncbi:MAG: hypothetical protein H7Y32_11290 [Chloroflexales bacterium]|nr:hypothetical protein [Chloroflexales bacterium]
MDFAMVVLASALLTVASLFVYWEVRRERKRTGDTGQHFWLWLAYSLSITGLTCGVLMLLSVALFMVLPDVAMRYSGAVVAMSVGIWFGFLGDRRQTIHRK